MIGAVLDPAILLPEQAEWMDETSRDRFVGLLIDHLDTLERLEEIRLHWSDELTARLWDDPAVPPWRDSRAWRTAIVPILFKRLNSLISSVDTLSEDPCAADPELECVCPRAEVLFLRLMASVAHLRPPVCLGARNSGIQGITFALPSGEGCFSVELVRAPADWLHLVDVEEHFWPSTRDEEARLAECLELVRMRDFGGSGFLYEFRFGRRFMQDVVCARSRQALARALAKRLVLTAQEAARDPSLHDELLSGSVHRLRVTQRPSSTRVHYTYEEDGRIEFIRYYGPGEHDDGLR